MALGAGLTIWSYRVQGDSWPTAIGKGLVVSGFSYAGATIGSALGFVGGGFVPGADLSGILEVAGSIGGGVAGGVVGGTIGSWFVNLF
jgi:hypothetical protein